MTTDMTARPTTDRPTDRPNNQPTDGHEDSWGKLNPISLYCAICDVEVADTGSKTLRIFDLLLEIVLILQCSNLAAIYEFTVKGTIQTF